MRARIGRPSPAMIVAIVALVAALSGTTWAAVNTAPVGGGGGASAADSSANANASATRAQRRAARRQRRANRKVIPSRNTVGVRQLRRNSVATGKMRNNSVTGAKVRDKSLTGADINLNLLGTVPNASNASSAGNASTVGGHGAACPAGRTLIRGVCFDSQSNGVVGSLKAASDSCANRGGWLPDPMELRSVRGIINLGTGVGTDYQYTDSVHANTSGVGYSTIVVRGDGNLIEIAIEDDAKYICVYPLVR